MRTDLLNKKFGKLTILEQCLLPNKTNRGRYWRCKCECGNIKITYTSLLTSGRVSSCGCARKRLNFWSRKNFGESTKNYIINQYKMNAKNKNLEFNLNVEEIDKLFCGNCFYCGVKPSKILKLKNCYGEFVYNGIDRVDNSIGYVNSNCVSCCEKCNYKKLDFSFEDFFNLIKKIYENKIK